MTDNLLLVLGLTLAVDLPVLVTDCGGVQLLVADSTVEATDVPALEKEGEGGRGRGWQ